MTTRRTLITPTRWTASYQAVGEKKGRIVYTETFDSESGVDMEKFVRKTAALTRAAMGKFGKGTCSVEPARFGRWQITLRLRGNRAAIIYCMLLETICQFRSEASPTMSEADIRYLTRARPTARLLPADHPKALRALRKQYPAATGTKGPDGP